MFMNEYDIARAVQDYEDHPVLGPATQTLANLADWADRNSDGWAYWRKPSGAAARLMALIKGDGSYRSRDPEAADERATPAAYAAALRPIRSFRTRQAATFEIVPAAADA